MGGSIGLGLFLRGDCIADFSTLQRHKMGNITVVFQFSYSDVHKAVEKATR